MKDFFAESITTMSLLFTKTSQLRLIGINLFAHLCFDVEAVGRRPVVKLINLDDPKLGVTKSSILVSTVNSEKKHLLLGGTECGWPP